MTAMSWERWVSLQVRREVVKSTSREKVVARPSNADVIALYELVSDYSFTAVES
jgi:hypothetical protein